jgi:competence protein ComEC
MTVAMVTAWVGGTEAGLSRGLGAALLAVSLAVLWLVPRGWAVALGVLLGALAAGAMRGGTEPWWTAPPGPQALRVDGRVVRGCDAHGDFVRCVVATDTMGTVSLRAPRGRCEAAPGDRVTAIVSARPVVPWRNPPLEDPSMQSLRRGLAWRLETAQCVVLGRDAGALDLVRRAARRARRAVDAALRRSLTEAGAARAAALLFGDERGLDDATLEAFRETGLAHLLAVSGAHVAVVLRGLGAAVSWLARRSRWIVARGLAWRAARVIPLPLAGFFVLMTGESPASVRALLSGVAVALLSLWGRRARALDVLALTVLAMTLVEPALAHDLGLQLSAVATAALVARAEAGSPPPGEGWGRRALGWALEALRATVRVGLAVTPLLALRFGRAPALATLANLLAAPLAEVVALPLSLATAAASMLSPTLAAPLGWVTERALALLFALAARAQGVPWASAVWPTPTAGQAVVATAALVALWVVSWRARAALGVAAVLAIGAMELRLRDAQSARGALRVTALDVGQGDAIVVDLPDGRTLLVDGGGALHGEADPGATVVVPWLRATRRTELAVVALTHPHPDHGGGLAAVLEGVAVGEFWETGQGEALAMGGFYGAAIAAAARRGVVRRGAAALCGAHRLGAVTVTVLAPCPMNPDVAPNDASLVLRLDHGRASALLPGDLEAAGERALLARLSPVTVLKVGHHGSRTSSTEAFLAALRPRVALVSSGHPSPFNHPHAVVVERFARRGIPLMRTDRQGLVSVTLRADGGFVRGDGRGADE